MEKAVEIIMSALKNRARIIIWGDYDVDGISGTCLLLLFFKEIGYQVDYHIPDRLTEGYGLNHKHIETLQGQGSTHKNLIISVDCGISNHAEVAYAKELGFDVIITDHHTPPKIPVSADAIINPCQDDCSFPFKSLAGVGVALYLCIALRNKLFSDKNAYPGINPPNLKYLWLLLRLGLLRMLCH